MAPREPVQTRTAVSLQLRPRQQKPLTLCCPACGSAALSCWQSAQPAAHAHRLTEHSASMPADDIPAARHGRPWVVGSSMHESSKKPHVDHPVGRAVTCCCMKLGGAIICGIASSTGPDMAMKLPEEVAVMAPQASRLLMLAGSSMMAGPCCAPARAAAPDAAATVGPCSASAQQSRVRCPSGMVSR